MERNPSDAEMNRNPDASAFTEYVDRQLAEIGALPENWDGEGSRAVAPAAVDALKTTLTAIAREDSVFPYLSPAMGGGVMAEWHAQPQAIVVFADPSGRVDADVWDKGAQRFSAEVDPENQGRLSELLAELSDRVQATNPTWRELFL